MEGQGTTGGILGSDGKWKGVSLSLENSPYRQLEKRKERRRGSILPIVKRCVYVFSFHSLNGIKQLISNRIEIKAVNSFLMNLEFGERIRFKLLR